MISTAGTSDVPRIVGGKYELDSLLGCGAFGNAYLAHDIAAKKWKVLKEIRCTECQKDALESSVREAKLLSKLEHPGILKYFDSFHEKQSFQYFYIVTEYCEGGDLEEKILAWKEQSKSFEETLVLDWFIQLMMAVQYMHHKKVLHRDLKTRNLFLKNNMIKVGDFGISKMLAGTSDMAQTFIGTLYYMSPEVLRHENYNAKSDIWAAGCIVHELCTLDKTFEAAGLMGVMKKITEGQPQPLPSHYSADMRHMTEAMLHKSPDQRPTASQVLKLPVVINHMKNLKSKMHLARDVKNEKGDVKMATCPPKTNQHRSLGSEGKRRGSNHNLNNTELPWVKENPEVFNSTAFQIRMKGPKQFLPENTDKPADEAYEDDFEAESDNENMDDFLECMENALEKSELDEFSMGEPSQYSAVSQNKNTERKMVTLRRQCQEMFGAAKFDQIYKYLRKVRFGGHETSEEEIAQHLKKMWENVLDCSLVDQLVFLEEQSKIS